MSSRTDGFRDGLQQGAYIGVEHTALAVARRDSWLGGISSVGISMADDFAVPLTIEGRVVMAMPREDFESMVRGIISIRDILLGLQSEPESGEDVDIPLM
jgi:hypothetical protein